MERACGPTRAGRRGFFHFDRPVRGEPDDWLSVARALSMRGSTELLLEAESSRGTYFEVSRGTIATVVRAVTNGEHGTLHGHRC